MFTYIYKDMSHSDTTIDYMHNLGMTDEEIESVLTQKEFEASQLRQKRLEAYIRKSDPLHMEWQYELAQGNPEADSYKQKWLESAQQVKKDIPV